MAVCNDVSLVCSSTHAPCGPLLSSDLVCAPWISFFCTGGLVAPRERTGGREGGSEGESGEGWV